MTQTIAMVLETPFPPDARVEREALALVEAGYNVQLLCAKQTQTDPDRETYHGVEIHRVWPKAAQGWQTKGALKNLASSLTGIETDWAYWVKRFIQTVQPQAVHVHDLKLLPTVRHVLQKQTQIRLVADLHENYPALVAHLVSQRKGPKRAAQKAQFWQAIERKHLPRVDDIIVVDPVAKDRLLETVPGLQPERITVLQNVVDSDKFLSPPVAQALPLGGEALYRNRFVLAYVGHVNGPHRGIHTVLEALALLKPHIPNVLLVAAGAVRPKYWSEVLQPIVEAHQLQEHIYFTGECPEEAFAPVIQRANICLCPHTKTTLTDTTFPNKVYQYHLFKKPLVTSNCVPLVRYAEETQGARVFESENAHSLADVILSLFQNPQQCEALGQAGQQAVLSRYCWAVEKQALLAVYQRLLWHNNAKALLTEDALTR